jgi:flagellar hook-length control protein FliK
MDSPDFAPALGLQVSILVREGVQEARLHLNPAEMGPIAVQIALEGQNAQVHFQADHAATREALQASLPELAAALQDNGFMLSGGGVSDPRQNAPGAQGGGSGFGERGSSSSAGAAGGPRDEAGSTLQPTAAAPRALRPQGVVDLYA